MWILHRDMQLKSRIEYECSDKAIEFYRLLTLEGI